MNLHAEPTKAVGLVFMFVGFVWLVSIDPALALGMLLISIGFYMWYLHNTGE